MAFNCAGHDYGEDELIEKEEIEAERAKRAVAWKRRKAWFCWLRRTWFLMQGLYIFDGHLYDPNQEPPKACLTCGQD